MKQYPGIYFHLSKNGVAITKGAKAAGTDMQKAGGEGFALLKGMLDAVVRERTKLSADLSEAHENYEAVYNRLSKKRDNFISKLFTSKAAIDELENDTDRAMDNVDRVQQEYDECKVAVDIKFDPELETQYSKLSMAFTHAVQSDAIWQIINERKNTDPGAIAKYAVDMETVNLEFGAGELIKCRYSAFHLESFDGPDIFIYPAFALLLSKEDEVSIVDLKDVTIKFHRQRFSEEEETSGPADAEIVDRIWYKTNPDGSKDMNYADNYQLPIVMYGALSFILPGEQQTKYFISNAKLAEDFANKFYQYQEMLYGRVKTLQSLTPASIDPLAIATRTFNGYSSPAQSHVNYIRPKFSKPYYKLLTEQVGPISSVIDKLMMDRALMEKIEAVLVESTPREFVDYCVLYDMHQVLRMVCGRKFDKDNLEMLGLILLMSKVAPQINTDFLGLGYEQVAESYSLGVFTNIADVVMEAVAPGNPLSLRVSLKEDDDTVVSSKDMDADLCLPVVLRVMDSKLFDEYVTVLYRYATIIAKADDTVTQVEEDILKNVYRLLHNPLPDDVEDFSHVSEAMPKEIPVDPNETLEDVLQELADLPGLTVVKQEITTLINYIKVQKEREKMGLKVPPVSYHYVFTGAPGTGKTTIARMVAKIYMHLGVLKKGHLVETDRSGLIAGYVGQTAAKVNRKVDSALDGVLFIDEAYALDGETREDYGKEAVATLVKRIEDDRNRLVVILAGYTKEMKDFIDMNPGFRSRFNRYIEFADYEPHELEAIFKLQCKKLDYTLAADAEIKLSRVLNAAYEARDRSFGNGRYVRNIFEKTTERQANRIAHASAITKELLTTITADDIP